MLALGFLSTIVGSLLLARGVGDDQLSQEILEAGRWATGQMAEDEAKGTS